MNESRVYHDKTVPIMVDYPPLGLVKGHITALSRSCLCLDTGCIRLKAGYQVQLLIPNGMDTPRRRIAIVMSDNHKGSYLFFDRSLNDQELSQFQQHQKKVA